MVAKKFRMPSVQKLEPSTSVIDKVTGKKGLVVYRQSAVYRVDLAGGDSVLRQRSQLVRA